MRWKTLSMNLNITLDNNLDQSLHMQIAAAIKAQISSGEIKPKEALPSVHVLARVLHISVNTTKKAYNELERQNLIYTVDDEVSFVTDNTQEKYQQEEHNKINETLKQIASTAKTYHIPIEEIHKALDRYYNET